MTRTNLGLSLAAAALFAGCGGGGGSGPSPLAVAPTPTAPAAAIDPVTSGTMSFTGPGTKVTVSVTIPRKGSASSRNTKTIRLPNLRTMANTSPTAKMRAAGLSLARARGSLATGRSPAYVSPSSYYMEFVINSGTSAPVVDETTSCSPSANTCTGTFDAPIGSGYTATLFLYDWYANVLSVGSTTNVTIVAGTANSIPITLNGVVAQYGMTTTLASGYPALYTGASFNDTITVALTPQDAEGNTIALPGVPIDNTFTQIASVSLAPVGPPAGISPGTATPITMPADPSTLSTFPVAFGWTSSAGSAGSVSWSASSVNTGGPLVPVAVTSPGAICGGNPSYYCYDGYAGYFNAGNGMGNASLSVVGPGLAWSDVSGYGNGNGGAAFYTTGYGNPACATDACLEIGALPTAPPVTYTLGLVDNQPYAGNQYTFTDVGGNCVGLEFLDSLPGTIPTGSIAPFGSPTNVSLLVDAYEGAGSCQLIATDNFLNSAQLTIVVTNPTLTIQQKKRK